MKFAVSCNPQNPQKSGAFISTRRRGAPMPKEIKDKEQFQKLLESASEVRVSRHGDDAKLKVRTREALYTFRTTGAEADAIIKGTKATVVEF
jgi:hypothetical protein